MKVKLFAIKDVKGDAFFDVMTSRAPGVAVREFEDIVNMESQNGQKNMFHEHPADFVLYEIGEFDNETGELIPRVEPLLLARGTDVTRSTPPVEVVK